MTQQPKLKRLANRKYQCDDIPALHRWLESQGYIFYGQHADDEYGRFSHQEAQAQAGEKSYSNGYIQVLTNGEILYRPTRTPGTCWTRWWMTICVSERSSSRYFSNGAFTSVASFFRSASEKTNNRYRPNAGQAAVVSTTACVLSMSVAKRHAVGHNQLGAARAGNRPRARAQSPCARTSEWRPASFRMCAAPARSPQRAAPAACIPRPAPSPRPARAPPAPPPAAVARASRPPRPHRHTHSRPLGTASRCRAARHPALRRSAPSRPRPLGPQAPPAAAQPMRSGS